MAVLCDRLSMRLCKHVLNWFVKNNFPAVNYVTHNNTYILALTEIFRLFRLSIELQLYSKSEQIIKPKKA